MLGLFEGAIRFCEQPFGTLQRTMHQVLGAAP